ncbi:hypothetical protein Q8723_35760, partial [Streptomyces cacaoi]
DEERGERERRPGGERQRVREGRSSAVERQQRRRAEPRARSGAVRTERPSRASSAGERDGVAGRAPRRPARPKPPERPGVRERRPGSADRGTGQGSAGDAGQEG